MKQYNFSFSGQTEPKQDEEEIHNNIFVKMILKHNLTTFIEYFIDDKIDEVDQINSNNICTINDEATFLLISTGNSAHSICEIISFINYYKNISPNKVIVISEYVLEILPLLFDLIKLFINNDKLIILKKNTIYKFNTLVTYRNIHFNYITNWPNINFSKNNDILRFNNLENIKHHFSINTLFLFDKIKEIYETYKNDFQLYENIMLIKTSNDLNASSTYRSILYPNENVMDILNKNNIKFLSIPYFKNIFHFICLLYHAKNIIFSYGGPCCTNRYFCNPNANVIVLANSHYKQEYDHSQNYWHLRYSHLCPVKSQSFLLDFENNLNENNINEIINLLV